MIKFDLKKGITWGTEQGRAITVEGDTEYSARQAVYNTSARQLLQYNEISMYVNRAVSKRADKVAEVKFVLKKGDEIIEKHHLLDLLRRPNPLHTGMKFWRLYQRHLDITGSAFIYLHKTREIFEDAKVSAMYLLRPDLVQPLFDADGMNVVGFEYAAPNGKSRIFAPEEVIWNFNPDPMNPLKGESLIRSGVRQIDTDLTLADYQNLIIKSGGRIEGLFKFKSLLNKEQIQGMKELYISQAADRARGIPSFLGGDSDYQNLALSPAELSYLESRKSTFNDITVLTGVPAPLLALTSEQTYANADAAMTTFLRDTIKPLQLDLAEFLDWRLVPEDLDLSCVDPTPEDVDRKMKVLKTAHEVNALSVNEKREMLGLDELNTEGADEILIPFSLTTLTSVTEEPEPVAEPEEEDEEPQEKRKSFEHPLKDDYFRKRYATLQEKRLDSRSKRSAKVVRKYFKDQEERILQYLELQKGIVQKQELTSVFNEALEVDIAKGTILPLIEEALKQAGFDATALFDGEYEFTLTSTIASWLDRRALFFARGATSTTMKDLKAAFQESLEAGESFTGLVDRIKAVYAGYDDARALTIARTEIHGAMQYGTIEAYRQVGSPVKIWVWAPGDQGGVREDHVEMDGKEMPLDMPFQLPSGVKTMYPGGSGDASEDINCACSI